MSRVGNVVRRGCRLLDYTRPETHEVVPRMKYLLGLHAGVRYDSGGKSERSELLTVYYMLQRKPTWGLTHSQLCSPVQISNASKRELTQPPTKFPEQPPEQPPEQLPEQEEPPVWPLLRKRLKLPECTTFSDADAKLNIHHAKRTRISAWVDCIVAPNLTQALNIISAYPYAQWPAHVVLYTYARKCTSILEAHQAVRLLQVLLPQTPEHLRPELSYMCLHMVQNWLVDLVPVVTAIFLRSIKQLSAEVANELVWRIADYGTSWDFVDITPLQDAQAQVVKAVGVSQLDTKGIFGLCYLEHFRRQHALNTELGGDTSGGSGVNSGYVGDTPGGTTPGGGSGVRDIRPQRFMEEHMHLNPYQSQEFAYIAGLDVMRILDSPTTAHALAAADLAVHHRGAVWACCAQTLARRHELTAPIARELFKRAHQTKCLNSKLVQLVISALPDYEQKLKVLELSKKAGFKVTPALVREMAKLHTKADLDEFKRAFKSYLNHPKVRDQLLQTLARVDPANFWETYANAASNPNYTPSRQVLASMCRAAWDPSIVWDGLYAAQRCTAEFKQHVRGVVAPSDDILRVYPDERMIYAYVVMLGRSQYFSELINCLEWMDKLELNPSKRVLLAVIHYSPQGAALLRMGTKLEGWPSLEEYEVYSKLHPKY